MYNLLCSRLFFSSPPPQQQFASVVFWGGPAHLKNWPGEKLQLCVVLVQGAWQVKGHRTFQACNALGKRCRNVCEAHSWVIGGKVQLAVGLQRIFPLLFSP